MINWISGKKKKDQQKKQIVKFNLLTRSFSDMLEIPEIDKLYHYIGSTLQNYYKDSIVLISKYDDTNKTFLNVFGLENSVLSESNEFKKILDGASNILPEYFQNCKTGKLKLFKGNFKDLGLSETADFSTKPLYSLRDLKNIYFIGINKGDQLITVIQICTLKCLSVTDIDFIELFVKQAEVIIHKVQAESAVKESEAHFSGLANMGQALIWTSGLDQKCNYFNKTWLDFRGRTLDEEVGYGWIDGVHPDDLDYCVDTYTSSFDKRQPFSMDYRIMRYDGQYRWIQDDGTPLYNENKEFIGYIGHCLDITERKKTEEQLQKFKLGIEQANEVIFITEPDGSFSYANPAFERVYGHSTRELSGKTPRILKSGLIPENDYKLFWDKLLSKQTITGEILNKTKDGKFVVMEGSVNPIIKNNGELLGYVAVQYDISKRKIIEREINKLNKAIEQCPVSIIITDTKGDIEYINPYFSTLTGYTYADTIGKNPGFLQSGEAVDSFYKNLWDTIISGKEWKGEFKNKKKNGQIYYEYAVISPVLDDNGAIINYVAVKEDITERKKAEELLKENEKILHEAQQLSRTGHFIIDFSTETFKSSPVIDDIFGVGTNFEKTVSNFSKLVATEYYNQMVEYYQFSPNLKNPLHQELKAQRHSDGQEIWVYIKGELQFDEKNEPKGYIGTIQDITERKKIEHDLLLSNDRLQSLLRIASYEAANIQDLLDYTLDEAIKLTESKIGYLYMYDEVKQTFILNSWSKEVHESCRVLNQDTVYELGKTGCWGEVVRQRQPIIINDYSADHPLAKGTPPGHVSLKKFLSVPVISDKKIVAVVGVANKEADYNQSDEMQLTLMMDTVWKIVERQKMIEELVAAKEKAVESDNLKSAFLANMSHEIRTPMNAIMGFSEILAKSPVDEQTVVKYGEVINSRSKYLLTLIEDILDLSKVEAGILTLNNIPFPLNQLFDEISVQTKLKVQKLKKNIELIFEKEKRNECSIINCDKNRIQQLLLNLIDNSLKFTQSGSITIKYESDQKKGIVFSVADTGIGIPPEHQKLIFERFHKSNDVLLNYSGLGLGLSICKGIVKILGGEIWVESDINKGSIFSFNIPVSFIEVKKPENKNQTPVPVLKDKAKGLILLVEDDEYNIEFIKNVLDGYEIFVAMDGASALDIFNKNPNIKLIFMDIGLPDISGLTVTQKIRETNTSVQIIALTAYVGENDKKQCLEAGCNEFLTKPVESSLLINKVNSCLEQFLN